MSSSKKKFPIALVVIGVILVSIFLCCSIAMIGGMLDTPDPPEPTVPVLTEVSTPASPVEALTWAIEDTLGDSNRDVPRIEYFDVFTDETGEVYINLVWAINDGSIARNAVRDHMVILKTIGESDIDYYRINLRGTFTFKDDYGNIEEGNAVHTWYSCETVDKIQWDTFDPDKIYTIAGGARIHHEFQP